MLRKIKILYLNVTFFIILICPISLLAGDNSESKTKEIVTISEQNKQLNKILVELTEKNKILEAQLQVTKDYHSSLLDTVYWALAGVFVILGLLLGFGWLANFRIYARDKDALRKQVNTQIEIESTNLKENVNSYIKELSEKQSKLLIEKLDQDIKTFTKKMSLSDSRIFRLELDIKKKQMQKEESPAMALTDALKVLELSVQDSPADIPDTIHFMLKKIEAGGKFTANEITRVQKILNELPTHYATLNEKLLSKLIASDIF